MADKRATQPFLRAIYQATPPTLNDGDPTELRTDNTGALAVNAAVSATTLAHSTAAAPTYVEGTDNKFSSDLAGNLRVLATVNASITPFAPNNSYATLAVTTTTSNVALPTGAAIAVTNGGTVTVFINLGTANTVTATTSQEPILPGQTIGIAVGTNTWIAGITASGTATLYVAGGSGLVAGTSSGGSVTQGTSPWVDNISQLNGTTVDTNSGTKSAGTLRVVLATDQPALTNALKVDGSAVTQPISGTVTANQGGTWTVQPGNTANTTAWKVDGSAVTQPVSGTVTANAGTGTFTVGGTAASGASVSGNPLLEGGRAATTNPTVVTDGQAVAVMLDVLGKLVSVLNAPRALKGVATVSTTVNTAVTLIAAGAAGVFNDIETIWFDNTSATGTDVTLSDGTNSHHIYVPPTDIRGITIPTMLNATSSATAWQITAATAVTTLYASATYVKRTA